jgi:thiamine pyrophosphokinase
MTPVRSLVFAGGDPPPDAVRDHLPGDAFVIAADSGLDHALALGRSVDLVVGDLDSVTAPALDAAVTSGTTVEEHSVHKDATDLELALDAARDRGATHVTVVGGHGGRVDHFAANLLLLASARYESLVVDGWVGTALITVVRGTRRLAGPPGSLCTLLAMGGPAEGVTTRGLRYPLDGEVLLAGSSRGVSNELVEADAEVTVASGTLLAIQPDALTSDPRAQEA